MDCALIKCPPRRRPPLFEGPHCFLLLLSLMPTARTNRNARAASFPTTTSGHDRADRSPGAPNDGTPKVASAVRGTCNRTSWPPGAGTLLYVSGKKSVVTSRTARFLYAGHAIDRPWPLALEKYQAAGPITTNHTAAAASSPRRVPVALSRRNRPHSASSRAHVRRRAAAAVLCGDGAQRRRPRLIHRLKFVHVPTSRMPARGCTADSLVTSSARRDAAASGWCPTGHCTSPAAAS